MLRLKDGIGRVVLEVKGNTQSVKVFICLHRRNLLKSDGISWNKFGAVSFGAGIWNTGN